MLLRFCLPALRFFLVYLQLLEYFFGVTSLRLIGVVRGAFGGFF